MLALIDNDVRTADPRVAKAEQAGATIIRWDVGHRIEAQICSQLDANELQDFISLRVERRGAESTVLEDTNSRGRAQMTDLAVVGLAPHLQHRGCSQHRSASCEQARLAQRY